MFFVPTRIKETKTGKGLFPEEEIPKGSIVGNFALGIKDWLSEDEYQKRQEEGDELIIMSGVRLVGRCFVYNGEIGHEEYINHSEDPSLLYHCGVCITRKALTPETEFTIDYGLLLASGDVTHFEDAHTGVDVNGLQPMEALLKSTRQLLELLESTAEIRDYISK